MNSQTLQRQPALLTRWFQPSKTDAELPASKYIEKKEAKHQNGKQFLAQNIRVKVSDWQRESLLV